MRGGLGWTSPPHLAPYLGMCLGAAQLAARLRAPHSSSLQDPEAVELNQKFIAAMKELDAQFEARNRDPARWTRKAGRCVFGNTAAINAPLHFVELAMPTCCLMPAYHNAQSLCALVTHLQCGRHGVHAVVPLQPARPHLPRRALLNLNLMDATGSWATIFRLPSVPSTSTETLQISVPLTVGLLHYC